MKSSEAEGRTGPLGCRGDWVPRTARPRSTGGVCEERSTVLTCPDAWALEGRWTEDRPLPAFFRVDFAVFKVDPALFTVDPNPPVASFHPAAAGRISEDRKSVV